MGPACSKNSKLPPLANRPPKWRVTYCGDLQGEIHGGIMTAMTAVSGTLARGAAKDKTITYIAR